MAPIVAATSPPVRLGLAENWRQFVLLLIVNACVGGMVGLERTVVPLIGAQTFHLADTTLITSFIVSFGVAKALTNLVSGSLADRFSRKPVLLAGWLIGLPVPVMIMLAPNWNWIVAANVLLGINQGLAWSMTVNMKIDLVGPTRRGLALGLNEFSGYAAVGLTAFLTGLIATRYGLRPAPFYLGIVYAVAGLMFSLLLVRDTGAHLALEHRLHPRPAAAPLSFGRIFARVSFGDRSLFAASQAGLVNNLNDGMSWGILPLFFAAHGLGIEQIGVLKAVYPMVWGLLQIVTGSLSDRLGRRGLIAGGMWVQACGLVVIAMTGAFAWWLIGSVLLGVGTAMVYPTLLAAVSDAAEPAWRARGLSVYRFWRDLGYAIGALAAGILADLFGLAVPIVAVAALTFLSGVIVVLARSDARHQERVR
jgi:MFS family permease